MFRLCLAPASMQAFGPEGRWPPVSVPATRRSPRSATVPADPRRAPLESIASWLRPLPKEAPRPHPNHPEGRLGRKWIHPKATHASARIARRRLVSDADRVASPKGGFAIRRPTPKGGAVVRAPALHPSAVARVPLESPLAADFRRPKALVVRAPLVSRTPEDAASNPTARPPKESRRTGEPVGHPEVAR